MWRDAGRWQWINAEKAEKETLRAMDPGFFNSIIAWHSISGTRKCDNCTLKRAKTSDRDTTKQQQRVRDSTTNVWNQLPEFFVACSRTFFLRSIVQGARVSVRAKSYIPQLSYIYVLVVCTSSKNVSYETISCCINVSCYLHTAV